MNILDVIDMQDKNKRYEINLKILDCKFIIGIERSD